MRFKRLVSILLVIILMAVSNINIKADDSDLGDHGDVGGGDNEGESSSRSTWNKMKSGYRFTIVNKDFNAVSNSVDLLFSDNLVYFYGDNDKDWYKTSRAHGFKGYTHKAFAKLLEDNIIDKLPPLPISYSGANIAVGTGNEFREWFLNGKPGFDGSFDVVNPGDYSGGSNNSGKGDSGGSHYETPDKPSEGGTSPSDGVIPDMGTVNISNIIKRMSRAT